MAGPGLRNRVGTKHKWKSNEPAWPRRSMVGWKQKRVTEYFNQITWVWLVQLGLSFTSDFNTDFVIETGFERKWMATLSIQIN